MGDVYDGASATLLGCIEGRIAFLGGRLVGHGGFTWMLGRWSRVDAGSDQLDDFVTDRMRADHIPGVSACILKSGRIAWSKGYGSANIARRIPMSAEHTIQNIGSISQHGARAAGEDAQGRGATRY